MKKLLSLLLALCLLCGLLPGAALSLSDDPVDEEGLEEIARIQKFLAPLIALAEAIDADLYTEDSVQNLHEALAEAATIPTERITQATVGELNHIWEAYKTLYSAYYSGLIPNASFSVNLRYSDNQFARHEVYGNPSVPLRGSGLIETVTVEPGTTLQSLVDQLGIDYTFRQLHAIINGLYVHFRYADYTSYYWYDMEKDIVLHPDDDIVVFTAIPETTLGAALGGDSAMLMQYINSLRLQRFEEESVTAEAARSFTLHATETNPALGKADGVYMPAAGLTIHVSEPQAEPGGLVTTDPLIVNGEPVVTDENGQAQLRLYGEGWVLVQAVNLTEDDMGNYTYYEEGSPITAGTYHSMESGAGIWVQITPSTRLDEVRAELLDELRAAYDSYDQTVFPENRLTAFQNAYDEAVAGINNSETTGAAYKAQQKGIMLMIRAYNNALNDNAGALSRFRSALSQLPDDVSLITEGDRTRINALLNAYNAMTAYQISLLLVEELEKYNAVAALGELPAEHEYSLTVNVVADTERATEVLNNMVDWLNSDEGRYYAPDNSGKPGVGKKMFPLYSPNKGNGFYDNAAITGSAVPGQNVFMITNFNYCAWLPVLYDDMGRTYVGDLGDEYTRVEGDGWVICDTQVGGVSIVNDFVIGNLRVLIDGVPYEPKGITWSGVEDITVQPQLSYIENSHYKGKTGFNVFFENPRAMFTMPYNDVTITVTWGPVDSSSAVSRAADALTEAYNSYVPGNYSDERWAELTAIYLEGVAAVRAAEDPEAVKDEYIARMAAVPADKPGSLLGSVTVTVSNNTCPDGPWYDETEPFVSETVDLYDTDTMMTVLLRALEENNFTWDGTGGSGFGITYLSSIMQGEDVLGEFTGGSGSGWMGMLNNWFVHQSFQEFSVAAGTLKNGDLVEAVYTCDLGLDVRSGWEGVDDTVMYDISMTNGTLSPAFDGATKEYVFTLDEGEDTAVLTFEPLWRCFQSRAYKGSYQPGAAAYYTSGDTVYLEDGDELFVASGDPTWPSMSGNSGVQLRASVYKITVVGSGDTEKVQSLINALPTVKYGNYRSCVPAVEAARAAYDALADKSGVDAERLETAELLIAEYAAVDMFKERLAKVRVDVADEDVAREIVETFDAMTDGQKRCLTGAETRKVEDLRERLASHPAVPGDLNNDGKVNNRDALLLFRYVSGVIPDSSLTVPRLWLDVNKDGKINNRDALLLFRYVSGVIASLPE